jgi:hypothetical protein
MNSIICAVNHWTMSPRTRVSLVFLAAVLGACGSDNTMSPLPPALLTIVAGDGQTATPGQALPTPLTVSLTTQAGDPVVGETVSWTIMSGTGSLSATSATTDAAGRASVNWTLGTEIGVQSVAASLRWRVAPGDNGFTSFGLSFSATATPPPPPPPTSQPVILRYDGSAWSVALQGMSDAPVSLNSVWGASSSEVFAVGTQCGQSLISRYDGTTWTQPAITCPGVAASTNLASVWGSSPSNAFLVDRVSPSPSPSQVTATSIYRFDGQATWNPEYHRSCSYPCDPYLNAVWSSSPTYVIAVGDSGFIVHYDGTAWTSQTSGTTQHLNAVWGSGSGIGAAIFAVGSAGTILSFDGTSWQAQASGTTQPLYGIWGSSPTDVFAVGGGGIVLHYDGNAWSAQTSGSTHALRGVWGNSGSSVYAVGDASTILRYDGTTWTPQATSASIDLRGVWGSSPTNLFAVGHPR